jgi:cytoskeleton protein RodZ
LSSPELGRAGGGPGARLRAAREAKGLSISDVASRTKVRADLLTLIEEGRFSELPEPVFTRSFLRTYAAAVGLDPAEIADSYQKVAPPPRQAPRRPSNLLPILGAIFLFLIVASGIAYYVMVGLRDRAEPTPADNPQNEANPAAATVRLSVKTTPPGAVVLVDRVRLGGVTPLTAYPITPGQSRELRLDLPGYQSYVATLDLTKDRNLDISLKAIPKPAPGTTGTTGTTGTAPAGTTGTARSGTTGTAPAAKRSAPSPTRPASPTPARPVAPAPAAQPESAPRASSVALRFSGRSWVRVTDANGRVLYEGIPAVGSNLSFPGPVRVRAGNPAVVSATAGGSTRSRLGGDDPVTLTLP